MSDGRIVLRAPVPEDAQRIADIVRASLPQLQPWLPWAVDAFDADAARDILFRDVDRQGDPTHNYVIVMRDAVVGACSTHLRSNEHGEIGYWVVTEHAGRGIATGATELLIRFGFDVLGLAKVFIRTDPENRPSQRVATKAGARVQDPPLLPVEKHSHPDGSEHGLIEYVVSVET